MTPEQQADLVGPEPVTGESGPVGGFFALLDPLLRRPTLVVEVDDGPIRPGQGRDDEAHPREELSQMMLDLGDHPPRSCPGGRLILEAAVADQRGMAGSAAGPHEQVLDPSLQHIVGGEADGVRHAALLLRLVERRERERRVGSDDDGLSATLTAIDDREEHVVPRVRTVDVARPERGGQAVAVLVEDEERVVADGLEVAIVGGLLLGAPCTGLSELSISRVPVASLPLLSYDRALWALRKPAGFFDNNRAGSSV